jgi:site-specific DNA-methyltransferase (adenine-specific)
MFNYDEMKKGHFPEDKLKIPEKQMRSVWCIPSPGQSEKRMGKHPTQKPIALLDRIIRASSKPNDIVLDPFCGSGTTGVSAIRNGRNFVGIERDWKYVELSARRISASLNGEKLKVEVFQNRGESDALSSIF